jgi:hypothetical protein
VRRGPVPFAAMLGSLPRRGLTMLAAVLALAAIPLLATTAPVAASVDFACVVENANSCVVTIPLTSNMDEQVGSTMPDQHPWSLHVASGTEGTGGYTLSGPGAPQTYWNGVSGATEGTVWSALLTTGTVTPGPSGADAVLTFVHVTSVRPSRHYSLFSYSYPRTAVTGSTVTITGIVGPVPPKGHLLLQRQQGAAWANVVEFTYSAATRRWTSRFRWPYPSRTTRTFRLFATAAPGLLATPSGPFRISTQG